MIRSAPAVAGIHNFEKCPFRCKIDTAEGAIFTLYVIMIRIM